MAINSKQKGAAGERELSHFLGKFGFCARRSQQYAGANGDADVVGVPGLHIECKRVERLNIDNALAQATKDARDGEIPIVFHRKNRTKWKVTLSADLFMYIYIIFMEATGELKGDNSGQGK